MQIDTGIPYTASQENFTAPTGITDLIVLSTSSTVPIVVQRIVMTAGVTASQIVRLQLRTVNSAGTGGTGLTNGPKPLTSSAAAATTVAYNTVTTQGTLVSLYDSQEWNPFAPYEFNMKPGGILIAPSAFLALSQLANVTGTYPCSFTVEFVELK